MDKSIKKTISVVGNGVVVIVAGVLMSAQNKAPRTIPLSAEIDVTNVRTLTDGNALRKDLQLKFYRDAEGDSRLEQGDTVTIVNSSAHEVYVLNLKSRTARVVVATGTSLTGAVEAKGIQQDLAMPSQASAQPSADLGSKIIDGVTVRGTQISDTIPAHSPLGNDAPITKTIQNWRSDELHLSIVSIIDDPINGTTTKQFKNVKTNSTLDPSLFKIPPGFKVSTGGPTPALQ